MQTINILNLKINLISGWSINALEEIFFFKIYLQIENQILSTRVFKQSWSFGAKLLFKGLTLLHTSCRALKWLSFKRSVKQSWSFKEQLGSKGPTLLEYTCICIVKQYKKNLHLKIDTKRFYIIRYLFEKS